MSPGRSVATCLSKYANFAGRASLSEYWWFFLVDFVALVVAAILDAWLGTLFVFVPIVVLGLALPMLAAGVRRLHDTNRSGWWWFFGLIPFVGTLCLLTLLSRRATPGDNSYGPRPVA